MEYYYMCYEIKIVLICRMINYKITSVRFKMCVFTCTCGRSNNESRKERTKERKRRRRRDSGKEGGVKGGRKKKNNEG